MFSYVHIGEDLQARFSDLRILEDLSAPVGMPALNGIFREPAFPKNPPRLNYRAPLARAYRLCACFQQPVRAQSASREPVPFGCAQG